MSCMVSGKALWRVLLYCWVVGSSAVTSLHPAAPSKAAARMSA
nr:hypothetical protein [Dietzia massiliensis]